MTVAPAPPHTIGAAPSPRPPEHAAEISAAHGIFQQPWWLDAVAPGRWATASVERDGEVVARLPYILRGPRHFRVISQPPLTPFLGPWTTVRSGGKPAKAIGEQMDLLAELESRLPRAAAYRQTFSPHMMNVLPFVWAGYRAEVRYTYRLEDLRSEEALWQGLEANIRGYIRKARKQGVEIRDDLGVDRFHEILAKTFTRQGIAPPGLDILRRIESACSVRGVGTMLFACDPHERVHAVAYVVRDRTTAYYLLSGADPGLRSSGAQSLLLWEAILRSRAVVPVFDFEGSMLRPVERFFRDFGGQQRPYLQVTRTNPPAAVALALRGRWQRRRTTRGGQ